MQLICVNNLLAWGDGDSRTLERVLWVGRNLDLVYTIDVHKLDAWPLARTVQEILEALGDGRAISIAVDPFARISPPILDSKGGKKQELYLTALTILDALKPLENEPAIFSRSGRGQIVAAAVHQSGASSATVYRILRRFWQRGKVPAALFPDLHKCGAPGKNKPVGGEKRGRKRLDHGDDGPGINVDEMTLQMFRTCWTRYYVNSSIHTLRGSFNQMLAEYYVEATRIDENGRTVPTLVDTSLRPTWDQYKYWYMKERDVVDESKGRLGSKGHALKGRALLGDSTYGVEGPGARFLIDASVLDAYLVSRFNRSWIIGRPVVYVIIDVFSRMIVGLYVGLEGPSWLGGMMALANAAADKRQFCSAHGVTIDDWQWPCKHLPSIILADRGEMTSDNTNALRENLRIHIENAPPYRPDWKGIVERFFRIINDKVKPLVPGAIDVDFRTRGGKDYRHDAKFDIHQFTEFIIRLVLHHNNEHRLNNYNRTDAMVSDDVSPKPLELWLWGLQHAGNHLRSFNETVVKLNLLPTGGARVTAQGIVFEGMKYSCQKAVRELWFELARRDGTKKLDVAYDPRLVNYIYIRDEKGQAFEVCELLEHQERYKHKTLDEVRYLRKQESLDSRADTGRQQQTDIELLAQLEQLSRKATAMTDAALEADPPRSKAAHLANIQEHRSHERNQLRQDEVWVLGKAPQADVVQGEVIPFPGSTSPPAEEDYLELILRKQGLEDA